MGKDIYNIINDMTEMLNASQMQKLQEVLVNRLSENITSDYLQTGNEKILDMFFTAKHLEGCSDKTIRYYRCNIEKMLETIEIHAMLVFFALNGIELQYTQKELYEMVLAVADGSLESECMRLFEVYGDEKMEVEIVEVKEEEKEVLLNLIEKYLYEFSQWEKTDVNVEGNYGYEYLDCYFEEENRYPYFIKVDGKLAGFAMISDYPEVPEETTDYCLSEFFVMHKYRRGGVGRKAINSVLDKHHGKWQLKRHPHNTVSVKFWDSVVSEYTRGNYRLVCAYPNNEVDYEDGTPADVFFFEN